jgi:hypothetical protein
MWSEFDCTISEHLTDNWSSRKINRLIDASRCVTGQSPVTVQLTNELTGLSQVGWVGGRVSAVRKRSVQNLMSFAASA